MSGLLTFTFNPADASGTADGLGLAGAWRSGGFGDLDDFWSVFALQRTFPRAPADADTVRADGIPEPFEWGLLSSWTIAGTAMKLVSGDVEALACRISVDEGYPVYVASSSAMSDPACAPDPADFVPGSSYDLVVYGGDAFADALATAAISAPAALEITSPDAAIYDVDVDSTADLEIAWTGDADGSMVVIRLWDQYGTLVTATANDDGSFTLPAAELSALTLGPAWLTVARERAADLVLPETQIRVVARYEAWAYLELV